MVNLLRANAIGINFIFISNNRTAYIKNYDILELERFCV